MYLKEGIQHMYNKYYSNITTLCEADIRAGRRSILETRLKECTEKEDFEMCGAIKKALDK